MASPKLPKWPPFSIIEDDEFLAQAQRVSGSIKAWDEVREFIDLYFARDPIKAGYKVPGMDLYVARLNTIPPHMLVYKVDSKKRQMILIAID